MSALESQRSELLKVMSSSQFESAKANFSLAGWLDFEEWYQEHQNDEVIKIKFIFHIKTFRVKDIRNVIEWVLERILGKPVLSF